MSFNVKKKFTSSEINSCPLLLLCYAISRLQFELMPFFFIRFAPIKYNIANHINPIFIDPNFDFNRLVICNILLLIISIKSNTMNSN